MAAVLVCAGCRATPDASCVPGGPGRIADRCGGRQAAHMLPLRAGATTEVLQGYHSNYSHKGEQGWAVDFSCHEGDPIVASRAGRVWDTKEDSFEGCPDASCADRANYVVLDHGDGTFSEYYHLAPYGALVEPGQMVCRGQVIGLCGTTGYSGGAHLHWSVNDTTRRTMPAPTFEMIQQGRTGGYPAPQARYTSANTRRVRCDEVAPSVLHGGAFIHQGVMIEDAVSMVQRRGTSHTIRGRYGGPRTHVALSRRAWEGGPWIEECAPVDDQGRFEIELSWQAPVWDAGFYWLMMAGADEGCNTPAGWGWSYPIRLDDERGPGRHGQRIEEPRGMDVREPRRSRPRLPDTI